MRVLVHLSDVHFGRVNRALIDPLIQSILGVEPDVVVISGDLTQRARSHQFKEARAFLDALPNPQIIVPGNHDIPLHNPFNRFLRPLTNYRRYITDDLQPFYTDDEIAVIGVNTARRFVFKAGRVNTTQIDEMMTKLCPLPDEVTKIIVTHHPFDLPEGHGENDLVGRSHLAMEALAKCKADLFLAGHIHLGHTGQTAKRYQIEGHSALFVSAGTATSTRVRGTPNSFNVIRVAHPEIVVERHEWSSGDTRFVHTRTEEFRHASDGWTRVERP